MKKTCFILAVLFLVFLPNANAALLTDNLIGYWKFDNNGADSSGGGRDLDLYGDPNFSAGLFGQALDLHSNNSQYAQRPVDDNVYNFSSSNFTIQVWVNLNSLSVEQVLLEKFQGASGPGWTLTYYPGWPLPTSEKFHFYTYLSARIYSNDLQVTVGQWHQIIMRRDGSTFELFYDNTLIGSVINSTIFEDSSYPLIFGRRNPYGQVFPLDGKLDEVAIWNRALSADEIGLLYNNGQGRQILPVLVTIDIKPGGYPNSINLKSNGVVPVAILTTGVFDASTVDPETVFFAGASPVRWTMEDVDRDGDMDLLFHFKTQELKLDEHSTEATLTGNTYDETSIAGTDTVNIVPKEKSK